ncbi:hypothetical protein ACFSSB_15580 [Lacinutrix gracilariae]|uniref:Lipoprotein n=1 Tax=Lacinutrix gracilariae TaxID=1747198 RepID=A0ABW5K823_9FLAO
MNRILLLALIVLILSCKSENKDEHKLKIEFEESTSETLNFDDKFQAFITQFPEIETPIKIKACDDDFSNLQKLNEKTNLIKRKEQNYIFCKIKTNGTYVAIITLEETECYMPVLTTFKPNGEKISSENLMIGLCGSDPCFECEELMEIDNDLNIYIAFNSRYFDCDENGQEIEGTEKTEVIYRNGKLTENGIIELTEKLKK